ncbi:MAG: toll/interleukin-1 receptor domain-containing protein [Clostridia bacterium]|nr:toll/interleukin-1 receptor domain-containing protein [Clostridia bacterium]
MLIDITKKIVNKLISERNNVTKAVGEENKKRKETIETRAKVKAKKAIKQDLDSLGVDQDKVDDIVASFDSKLKGDNNLKAKELYKLFISHARKDRRFSDFIYNLIIKKGALPEEVFYTTRQVQGNSTLSQDIKRNIMEINTMVLFLDSANFMRSSYCLFEGGAFWATRSMDSCIHIHFDTAWIPDYINDHEKYHVPLHQGKVLTPSVFALTQRKYNELVQVLNIIIEHLNSSALHNGNEIALFEEVAFPPEIEMERKGQSPQDFMDSDFVNYWNYYVVEGKTDITQEGNIIDCDSYISEYNKNVEKLK